MGNTRGGYTCTCGGGYADAGDGGCNDINECSINDGTCANSCSNYQGGYSCGCQNRAFKVGNSHCISSPNGFEQYVPNNSPGYQQGWQSGPVKRPVGHATRICYGCSHEERRRRQLGHGRRGQQNRGRREADDVVDLVDMEGASPDDKIEETLPIEISLNYQDIIPGQVVLNLEPARQPLKDNMKYFIAEGNEDKIFRIYQVHGRAKLHLDKRKHNEIKRDGEYVLKLKGVSMLEPDVIDILSDNVETIKAELADPLHQLTIHLTFE